MFCPNCGKESTVTGEYCMNCGVKLPAAKNEGKRSNRAGCFGKVFKGCLALAGGLVLLVIVLSSCETMLQSLNDLSAALSSSGAFSNSTPPPSTSIVTTLPLPAPSPEPPPAIVTTLPSVPNSSPGKALTGPETMTIGIMSNSTENISRQYSWFYKSKWSWNVTIPSGLYDYYRKLPRSPTRNYSVYVTHPLDDPYLDALVKDLTRAAENRSFSEFQTVEFVTAFVQNMPYTVDNVTTPYDEYPRYPIETLVDAGGDCEDTSILLASILDRMGYGVILISPPHHMAVGVKGSGNLTGTYWKYQEEKYYYVETTDTGWRIGELPGGQNQTLSARLYPIVPVPVLIDNWRFRYNSFNTTISINVTNLGTAPANNVTILAGYDAGDNMLWNIQESEPFAVGTGQQVTVTLSMATPYQKHTRMVVEILIDGRLVGRSYSDWIDT